MEATNENIIYCAFFLILGLGSIFKWRVGFIFFLIYIFFEDAIRMKFFNNNILTQISKDLVLIGIYLGWLLERSFKIKFYKFTISIIIIIAFQAINIFNPQTLSLSSGIAGLKLNFFYFPIFWIASDYFSNPARLQRYFIMLMIIMSLLSIVALIQTIFGPDFWWDFFGNYDPLVHFSYHTWKEEAPVFRPFAIFNNSGRFMHLLFIYYFYLLLLWALQDVLFNRNQRFLLIICIIIFVAGFFYSINRTSFLVLAIITFAYTIHVKGMSVTQIIKQITIKRIAFAFIIIIVFYITSSVFRKEVKDIIEFLVTSVIPGHKEFSVIERFTESIENVIKSAKESGLFGHGTGSQSLGLTYFFGSRVKLYLTESGYANIIWEMGLVGFFLWLYMWKKIFSYFFILYKNANLLVINVSYIFMLLIISIFMVLIVGFQTFQSWIFNIMFWNFLGIIIAIIQNDELYMKKLYQEK